MDFSIGNLVKGVVGAVAKVGTVAIGALDSSVSVSNSVLGELYFDGDGDDYIVWLWKGDYLNLGVGAETGIYKGGEPLWECDTNDAMPMTLRVEDTSGNVI